MSAVGACAKHAAFPDVFRDPPRAIYSWAMTPAPFM